MAGAGSAVGVVVSHGVSDADPAHKLRKVAVMVRVEQEMPVVAHDAVAADAHVDTVLSLAEYFLEREKVITFLENTQPSIGTIEYMIKITAGSFPDRSSHNSDFTNHNRQVKKKRDLTPLYSF